MNRLTFRMRAARAFDPNICQRTVVPYSSTLCQLCAPMSKAGAGSNLNLVRAIRYIQCFGENVSSSTDGGVSNIERAGWVGGDMAPWAGRMPETLHGRYLQSRWRRPRPSCEHRKEPELSVHVLDVMRHGGALPLGGPGRRGGGEHPRVTAATWRRRRVNRLAERRMREQTADLQSANTEQTRGESRNAGNSPTPAAAPGRLLTESQYSSTGTCTTSTVLNLVPVYWYSST